MGLTLLFRGYIRLKLEWMKIAHPWFHRLQLRGMGVRYGTNCKIIGVCSIRTDRTSKVEFGDNLRIFSSNLTNPLCNSKPSIINVSKGAVLKVGDNCGMSSPTIWVRKGLIIGNNVNFGGGITVMDSDAHSLNYLHRRNGAVDMQNRIDREIIIGDDVLIGMNSIILKGVHIGARSVIGAGSVVTKDIPADCIAAGNPARVIKMLDKC